MLKALLVDWPESKSKSQMAKLSQLQSDPKISREGVWVPYQLEVELLVGRSGTPEYDATIHELTRPYLRIYRNNIPEDIRHKITCKALAKHCLLGWRGLDAEGATAIQETAKETGKRYRCVDILKNLWIEEDVYSSEKAESYLADPQNYDLYRWVVAVSNEHSLYRKEVQEDQVKNS